MTMHLISISALLIYTYVKIQLYGFQNKQMFLNVKKWKFNDPYISILKSLSVHFSFTEPHLYRIRTYLSENTHYFIILSV